MSQHPTVIGALTDEERAIIDERDAYREKFRLAPTDEERDGWLAKMDEATRRYDAVRARRRAAGEID